MPECQNHAGNAETLHIRKVKILVVNMLKSIDFILHFHVAGRHETTEHNLDQEFDRL